MKSRTWIIIFSTVILLCLTAHFLFAGGGLSQSGVAGIYQDGVLKEKIDLNSVTEERKITLTGENGQNTILVSKGRIEMLSADCDDKICVNHGELTHGGTPIICLPNKIVIRWENSSENHDAKTGE